MKTRKFTIQEVQQIRETYAAGKGTCESLAERYGVTAGMIWKVVAGKNYRDAGGPITVVYRPRAGRPKPEPAQRAYAALDDFRRHGPKGLQDLPEGAIIAALVAASAEVDAILRTQGYELPLTEWSDDVRRATCDLAAPMLLVRRARMDDRVFVSVIGDRAQQAREMLRSARTTRTTPTALTIGSKVRLVSGGPSMTVLQIHGDTACTTWFDAGARNHTATFPTSTLEMAR